MPSTWRKTNIFALFFHSRARSLVCQLV